MSNKVIHFEVQADDVNRAKEFYEKAFGWKITPAMSKEKGDAMDYWMLGSRFMKPLVDSRSRAVFLLKLFC